MEHLRLLIYLTTIACGLILISSVIHLYPKYPKEYLKKYLIHVINLNVLAILSMFYRYLNLFASSQESSSLQTQLYLRTFIFVPAIIVTLFNLLTYLTVVIKLFDKIINKTMKVFAVLSCSISVLFIFMGIIEVSAKKVLGILLNYLIYSDFIVNLIIFVTSLVLLFYSYHLEKIPRKKLIQGFLSLYGCSYFLVALAFILKKSIYPFFYFSSAVSFLLLNLIPLLFIRTILNKTEIQENVILTKEGMDKIFDKYGLTRREKEIIQLVYAGKSNKDIEELLWISVKTVKYHLYNIYKKLKIKNRLELINLFIKENSKIL